MPEKYPACPVFLKSLSAFLSWRLAIIIDVMCLSRLVDVHFGLLDLARWLRNFVNEFSDSPIQVLNAFWSFIYLTLSQQVFDLFYNHCSLFCKHFALICCLDKLDHIMPILIKFGAQENVIVVPIVLIHPLGNIQVDGFSL
jgi:hypothetical protein